MKPFMDQDFLLSTPTAQTLYHDYAESMPIMTDWKERFIEAYDIEFCKWVESVHAGKLTGPSSWDGYVACVAGDALNASRGTSQFLKVETMEKPEMYK